MRVQHPVEVFYLALMHRWYTTAPPDKHLGSLDGDPARNTQVARLAFVLQKVAAGQVQHAFSTLEKHTEREDGISHISKAKTQMREPYPLWDGWYLEGNMSMDDKRERIIRNLRHVGVSAAFIRAVEDFVEGKSIEPYFPTAEEEKIILAKIAEREAAL